MFRTSKRKRGNFYSNYLKEQEGEVEVEQIPTPKPILKKVKKVVKKVKFTPKTTEKEDLVITDSEEEESSGDEYPESEYRTLLIELGESHSMKDFFATNKTRINRLPTEEVEMLLNQASKKL